MMPGTQTTASWTVDVPPYNHDGVVIEHMEITQREADFDKLRAAFNPQRNDRSVDAGVYTKLTVDGVLWMSDTPAECEDLRVVDWELARAESALIVGLGLGVVLNRALRHGVAHIDVVEREERVLAAVGAHYVDMAAALSIDLTIHCANIHDWRAPKGRTWDVGFFDIWDTISMDDMPEVTRLRKRFGQRLGYFEAWAQAERIAQAKRIRTGAGWY
jgi:hypothetical protein